MEFRFAAEAEEDIEQARLFLEAYKDGLGERFRAEIRAALDYIEVWPRGFQIRYEFYRFAPLAMFRYQIIYSIEGEYIVVHRIRHMRQRPLKRYFGSGA